jgi:hypothetical protein
MYFTLLNKQNAIAEVCLMHHKIPTPTLNEVNTLFSGDLERLGRFWMSGTCKPNEQEKRASEPLSIAQFLSAFLLLGIGTLISVVLFLLEHAYMRYLRNHVVDKGSGSSTAGACCALVSQVQCST